MLARRVAVCEPLSVSARKQRTCRACPVATAIAATMIGAICDGPSGTALCQRVLRPSEFRTPPVPRGDMPGELSDFPGSVQVPSITFLVVPPRSTAPPAGTDERGVG